MASIGDVAAVLRTAMQMIDEATASAQSAEIETGQAVAGLRMALEDSSNQLVGEGIAQWEQAKAQVEEALTLYQAGNEAMSNYVAAIAGGGSGTGAGTASTSTTTAPPTHTNEDGGISFTVSVSDDHTTPFSGGSPFNQENSGGDDDSAMSKPRRLGRKLVRNVGDEQGSAKEFTQAIDGLGPRLDPWGSQAKTESVHQGPSVSSPQAQQVSVSDAVGSLLVVGIAAAEGISRLMGKRDKKGEDEK